MAQELDIVEIEGKRFYMDNRLQEYRAVDNPHHVISFEDQEAIDDLAEN